MLFNCGVREDSWESLGLQGDPTSLSLRKSVLNIHWKDWCWSLNSNTLTTWCKEPTNCKRPWYWERLKAGEGGEREWDAWMVSLTQWTCTWANSRRYWRTGKLVHVVTKSQTLLSNWTTTLFPLKSIILSQWQHYVTMQQTSKMYNLVKNLTYFGNQK